MTMLLLTYLSVLMCCAGGAEGAPSSEAAASSASDSLVVAYSDDFEVTGEGSAPNWERADWVEIPQRGAAESPKTTKMKALYSDTGLYFLFHNEDEKLTSTMEADFMNLWEEDVVEVFLWPEEAFPVYFEYELSPLNYELPILVPNNEGEFLGWRPWRYEGERKTRHATSVQGGEKESGAEITSWRGEVFIPFALLKPLGNVPPKPGGQWRANFYRVDHDGGAPVTWQWQETETSFHEISAFGAMRFGAPSGDGGDVRSEEEAEQDGRAINLSDTLLLESWHPQTVHQVSRSDVSQAAHRAVDVHTHAYAESKQDVDQVVEIMDRVGVETLIVLTGATGDEFQALTERYADYPDRFELWCGVDYDGYMEEGWSEKAAAAVDRCAEMGATGIGELSDKGKGLVASLDPDAQMHPSDPRMDPVFEKAAELDLPVNIHIAEPIWMYEPMDAANDGLTRASTWSVEHRDVTVDHSGMIDIMEETLQRHPGTTFIACHLMNLNNDLSRLGDLLDQYPNLYVDIGARFAEFGTIPRYAAQFFEQYQDRILYGTDYGWETFNNNTTYGNKTTTAEMYRMTFRVLETTDDHFYLTDLLGYKWPLYGLGLSDQVLEKIYRANAERVLDL